MTDFHHYESVETHHHLYGGDTTSTVRAYSIGKDGVTTAGLSINSTVASMSLALTLDDLDALRQAITRLLVKVQAETETRSPTVAPLPAAATGMVTGMASVHTPASVVA